MRALPLDIGPIHFVGIGGIGMSGIAEVLHNLGYAVQGSDLSENANVKRLRDLGVRITVGHDAANLGEAQVVVISSAVKGGNPEVDAARARLVPVVRRAEMLGELMRLKWAIAIGGTHGKTTTTSMVAALLEAAGFDPTVINGGILNARGTNAYLGHGDWMVVEADESDGTFTKLPATIGVVTNMDAEHLDFYGSFERMREAYKTFVQNLPFYGFATLCIDHPEVQSLIPEVLDRKIVTYGFSPQADVRAVNLRRGAEGARFEAVLTDRATGTSATMPDLFLPMFGRHNVQNALAAVAIGHEMGIPAETIRAGLAGFKGVRRRFTRTGTWNGVTIVDDYGHHPVEIAAVLGGAREVAGEHRVIAVVQPHRYTRLQALFEDFCTCFNDADEVLVADVYPAGEAPIPGIDRDALVDGLRTHGHRNVTALAGPDSLPETVAGMARPGDLVMCLGAGTISGWANALPGQLQALGDTAGRRPTGTGGRL
ncbi:UDP-N-acetylmuramate--L-alanine ligase [Rhodospira trueperi]|uniref:UDP-N-acetylmuramate--L-alanine ligase n=1 Tax=Rhodospira trueperi TaxID=69960 RepID=A0A1G6YZS9_9PROT|nr:UDP-N-acetylmuramate--L-alanine ligase [Rhodospira trueperi]SDD95076.1 UDP-N-acetylmuramate--alanine ligase [Rhodospira trueperi]